jgi:hypothetical protein
MNEWMDGWMDGWVNGCIDGMQWNGTKLKNNRNAGLSINDWRNHGKATRIERYLTISSERDG